MEPTYDRFQPFKQLPALEFLFVSHRYEVWAEGKLIQSETVRTTLSTKKEMFSESEQLVMNVISPPKNDHLYLFHTYDAVITQNDRVQMITVPVETNINCPVIIGLKSLVGHTRQKKNFHYNEPCCCNIFTHKGRIAKITFSLCNPEKLVEFYSEESIFNFQLFDRKMFEN